jgi:hypothetical protein
MSPTRLTSAEIEPFGIKFHRRAWLFIKNAISKPFAVPAAHCAQNMSNLA